MQIAMRRKSKTRQVKLSRRRDIVARPSPMLALLFGRLADEIESAAAIAQVAQPRGSTTVGSYPERKAIELLAREHQARLRQALSLAKVAYD